MALNAVYIRLLESIPLTDQDGNRTTLSAAPAKRRRAEQQGEYLMEMIVWRSAIKPRIHAVLSE